MIDAIDIRYGRHLFDECPRKAHTICRTADACRYHQGKTTMSKRIAALPAVAALALSVLASATAMAGSADRTDAVSVPGVIGAAYNSPMRADGAADVQRQSGFATAGAVRWLAEAPAAAEATARSTFNSPGVMGAMGESRSLARSADEVRRQGGFATAAAVHWLAKAPAAKKVAAS